MLRWPSCCWAEATGEQSRVRTWGGGLGGYRWGWQGGIEGSRRHTFSTSEFLEMPNKYAKGFAIYQGCLWIAGERVLTDRKAQWVCRAGRLVMRRSLRQCVVRVCFSHGATEDSFWRCPSHEGFWNLRICEAPCIISRDLHILHIRSTLFRNRSSEKKSVFNKNPGLSL